MVRAAIFKGSITLYSKTPALASIHPWGAPGNLSGNLLQ